MTVSTSKGRRRTIGQVLLRAGQLAGVVAAEESLKAPDRALLRSMLEDVLDDLANEGVSARARTFEKVSVSSADVTAETYKFDLDSGTQRVIGDGMWIPSTASDTDRAQDESLVKLIDWESWHLLTNKAATADRPTLMYEHRESDTIQVWLWQIPTDAGTLRVPVERHLSDVDDDNATLDLPLYWYRTVAHTLAADFRQAKGMPVEEQMLAEGKAARMRKKAVDNSKDEVDLQMSIRRY